MKDDGIRYHQVLSLSPECWTKMITEEIAVVGSVYCLSLMDSVVQYHSINVICHNEHRLHITLCRAHCLWTRGARMLPFISLSLQMWFVRASPSFVQSTILPRKSSPSLWYRFNKSCAIAYRCHCCTSDSVGVPNVLQFCGSQECRAECGARFCGICLPQQLTPVQSIDVLHPAKKQGAQLCGCQHGVFLNDGCPEWNPSLYGTISPIVPLCGMAKQHHPMLLAVLENRFVHYDLVQLQFLSRSVDLLS